MSLPQVACPSYIYFMAQQDCAFIVAHLMIHGSPAQENPFPPSLMYLAICNHRRGRCNVSTEQERPRHVLMMIRRAM